MSDTTTPMRRTLNFVLHPIAARRHLKKVHAPWPVRNDLLPVVCDER